jgi:hypothetical protein
MIISEQEQNIVKQDSVRYISDTSFRQIDISADSLPVSDTVEASSVSFRPLKRNPEPVDTTSDGTRPVITFYDTANFILSSEFQNSDMFPFVFIEKNNIHETKAGELLIQNLREGKELPQQPLKEDWLIFVVLAVSALYIFISTVYKRLFYEMKRFFLFRGVGDPASRDIQVLFHWKSTIINLVSFLNIGLFAYCAADFYEFIPDVIPGILFWLICFVITVTAITFRHFLCLITGNISGAMDLFSEYIITIYHSYRYLAVILFILVILVLYTGLFSVKSLFLAGLFALAITYLIRIFRFFLIFLKKNISIFYLILYLCALEFLPVLVLIKYITGLF